MDVAVKEFIGGLSIVSPVLALTCPDRKTFEYRREPGRILYCMTKRKSTSYTEKSLAILNSLPSNLYIIVLFYKT